MKNFITSVGISLLIIILGSCQNSAESPQQNSTIAKPYTEGQILHFKWKENNDSHEIILSAVRDSLYHTKALRILGYQRTLGSIPCDINGIFTPDSGFQFTLFDAKYNETGLGRLYISKTNQWILDVNRLSKTQTYNVSQTENFNQINIKMLYEKDCKLAEQNKKHPENLFSPFDTSCSTSQIFYPQLEDGNPMQSLIFNKDSFLLLPGNETYYREIFGSFFPVFADDKYLSLIAQSYIFSGGAHGMPATTLINIHKPTNRMITFNEIIDTNQLQSLNRACKSYFVNQVGNLEEWNFGETGFYVPKELGILSDGLVFHYQAYEIGTYAQGMPEFFVPWKALKPYINPDFQLP